MALTGISLYPASQWESAAHTGEVSLPRWQALVPCRLVDVDVAVALVRSPSLTEGAAPPPVALGQSSASENDRGTRTEGRDFEVGDTVRRQPGQDKRRHKETSLLLPAIIVCSSSQTPF
jgi:hypothetical protein